MSSPAQIIPGVVSEVRAFTAAIDMFEHAIERRLGLSRTELRCVQALAATGTLTPAEVSQASGCSLEAVTRALARLEAGRYVDCRSGAQERVALTSEARATLAEIYAPLEAASSTLHRYGADELAAVRRFLRSAREVYEREASRLNRQET